MTKHPALKKHAKVLRIFRKIHRYIGAFLFLFFIIISVSGILLGWKKLSNGVLLPESQQGTSTELKDWISIDSLHTIACYELQQATTGDVSLKLERIDIRKENGMVKFVFEEDYWEVQLDGATGNPLQIAKRQSDFLENIHDGTIFGTSFGMGTPIKIIYTSIMGIALLIFSITGFWMWYGPKKMRRIRKK
jgi:uncharacterized iron-regulated membrane protein